MDYNIFSNIAPAMPKPSKGTEFIKFAISQASKDMQEVLIPMAIPALAAHLTDVRFMYSDNKYYEMCGQMGHLIGPSGIGKAQLGHLVEAIMRPFRKHDETEFKKLVDWQRQMKTKGANKEKPERPDVSFWFPPSDVTNPAFIQNAMACEQLGGRTQYINLPEVEMADRMCGGHKQVSQMVRNIFDCQRAGALRATADGVTGNPLLREPHLYLYSRGGPTLLQERPDQWFLRAHTFRLQSPWRAKRKDSATGNVQQRFPRKARWLPAEAGQLQGQFCGEATQQDSR